MRAEIKRVPVMVYVGMTPFDGDCPATCVPFEGGKPVYCYMTRELADEVTSHHPVAFWGEFNGVSYDLIGRMTDDEIKAERARELEAIPF